MLRYRAVLNRLAIAILTPGVILLFVGGIASGIYAVAGYAFGVFVFVFPLLYLNAEWFNDFRNAEIEAFWLGRNHCAFCGALIDDSRRYWCDETCRREWVKIEHATLTTGRSDLLNPTANDL